MWSEVRQWSNPRWARRKLSRLIREIPLARFVRDVPIEQLRHDDKQAHVAEGYGGRPIELFPPFQFFALHESGRADEARAQFHAWYRRQFDKYSGVGKDAGGMRNGSLYRLVVAEHARLGIELAPGQPAFRTDIVDEAIRARVEQRFEFLRSIKERGYDRSRTDPVIGIARGADTVHLTGGHHRAAALKALGQPVLPGVVVLSPVARYVFRKLRIA